MTENSELNRVFWHSRRGMLELDLVLVPFVKNVYATLPLHEQEIYKRLLECEDTELFAWALQRSKPADTDLAMIMEKIIHYAKQQPD